MEELKLRATDLIGLQWSGFMLLAADSVKPAIPSTFGIQKTMNWYIAKLVYQVISGEGNHTPQFDEQLRLIRAEEFEWAREKAGIVGKLCEYRCKNEKNEEVHWKFIDVIDICPIKSLEDGDEIYSSTQEPKDVTDYLSTLSSKAKMCSAYNPACV